MLMFAALLALMPFAAFAGGSVPAVNTDMGCSAVGQAVQYDGSVLVCAAPKLPSTTVASLPTCNAGNQGVRYMVTNALGPVALAAVVAGGAVKVGVTCDGVSWIIQ